MVIEVGLNDCTTEINTIMMYYTGINNSTILSVHNHINFILSYSDLWQQNRIRA